ncbi:MAG: glycoside hydrolase family 9 protein [Agriterribacter sp.]
MTRLLRIHHFRFLQIFSLLMLIVLHANAQQAWIRINQLGYTSKGIKVAVWCGKKQALPATWSVINAVTNQPVFTSKITKAFGAYGPFDKTARLDFSAYSTPGKYYLKTGEIISPTFEIGNDVYKGAADFCLRYMRQQRSWFNPVLKDSCHTRDGYTLYGPMPDSTYMDVSGGWHDATDYLQYSSTSANATFHLLASYRDFPYAFEDHYQENGLEGSNTIPDVLDEAHWGLDWLLKMHPKDDWMFNQVGDDRDHMGFRMPQGEKAYGRGFRTPGILCNRRTADEGKIYECHNRHLIHCRKIQ